MNFSELRRVTRQSPGRRAVYLHKLSETDHVKKHFGLLVQKRRMGSPNVDFFLDFSVEQGSEKVHKTRRLR